MLTVLSLPPRREALGTAFATTLDPKKRMQAILNNYPGATFTPLGGDLIKVTFPQRQVGSARVSDEDPLRVVDEPISAILNAPGASSQDWWDAAATGLQAQPRADNRARLPVIAGCPGPLAGAPASLGQHRAWCLQIVPQ